MKLRKREKIFWIILASVLVFSFILVPSYKVIKAKINAPKIEQQEKEWESSRSYEKQNSAFGISKQNENHKMNEYIPYTEVNEHYLTIYINAYNYEKSSNLELKDIEEFLKEPTNADGSPKTYQHASEIVRDYVNWYFNNDANGAAISIYINDLSEILTKYNETHPEAPDSIRELSIDQINELCSHYTGDVNTYPYEQLHEEWS